MVIIMELKKYKNRNKRKPYVILMIGFLLISISTYLFYKSYALYEEAKNFDVINGTVEDPGDIYFAYYIDGEISREMPKQNTGYVFDEEKSNCNNDTIISWDHSKWIATIDYSSYSTTTNTRTKCTLYFDKVLERDTYTFNFTGSEQQFQIPFAGKYKIEAWGARGGNATGFQQNYGGKGAYVSGDVYLNAKIILYLNVGGIGEDAKTNGTHDDGNDRISLGGYNGGATVTGHGQCCGAGGGGATHVALKSGLLQSFDTDKSSVLMVASGGGGASRDFVRNTYEGSGGSGGILNGYDGKTTGNTQCLSYGANRLSGGSSCSDVLNGSFGKANSANYSDGGGGGAGYYGGGTAICSGGSGGSSFVNGDKRFLTQNFDYIFTNIITIDGEESMPSFDGDEKMIGNSSNGFIRISYLGT